VRAAFCLAVACAESVSQSVKDSRQNAEQQAARIPFELNDNHIFLQGRVNNSDPLWFVLDTGSCNYASCSSMRGKRSSLKSSAATGY
jgi:hypothetical protein